MNFPSRLPSISFCFEGGGRRGRRGRGREEREEKGEEEEGGGRGEGTWKRDCSSYFHLQDQLPRIELHTVASVVRALRPLTHTTVKGDAYYFLASVFKQ